MATLSKKTFSTIFREKGITGGREKLEFLKKNPGEVSRNSNSHNYGKKGSPVKYGPSTIISGSGISYALREDGSNGNHIYWSEMFLAVNPLSKKGLNSELDCIKKEQAALTKRKKAAQEKLAFLKEVGVDDFSENEYKTYMTLKTLEKGDLSTLDKAKAIAKLIDG